MVRWRWTFDLFKRQWLGPNTCRRLVFLGKNLCSILFPFQPGVYIGTDKHYGGADSEMD